MYYKWKNILQCICILFIQSVLICGIHIWINRQTANIEQNNMNTKKIEKEILEDLRCFPIPERYQMDIEYQDTYLAERKGGQHEGCDLMDKRNEAGRIHVISATNGVITNVGWLYLGGYRIGITSDHGIYYYYAHLDSYASGIKTGKKVTAGELLGFMGNTEGVEGTEGLFDVHLHFGIYIKEKNGNEKSVNSYPFLKKIDAD